MSGIVSFNKELQSEIQNVTTKTTLPAPINLTGTVLTDGVGVRGTGTKFTSELTKGEFVYNGTVLRQIDRIVSDTLLFLTKPFPSNLASGSTLQVPGKKRYRGIAVTNTGAASGSFNEDALAAGAVKSISNDAGLAPVSVDGTGTNLKVELYF